MDSDIFSNKWDESCSKEEKYPIQQLNSTTDYQKLLSNLKQYVEKLDAQQNTIDIAFLIDATTSMKPYIGSIKEQVQDFVRKIQQEICQFDKSQASFAYVVYRDYYSPSQYEVFEFSNDIGAFRDSLKTVKVQYGDDFAEDIVTGLEQILKLKWRNSATRLLIHIADAPTHGVQYYDCSFYSDDYPDGARKGRKMEDYVVKLYKELKLTNYWFFHVQKRYTEQMIINIKSLCDGKIKKGFIQEIKNITPDSMSSCLVKSTLTSISQTLVKTILNKGAEEPHENKFKIGNAYTQDIKSPKVFVSKFPYDEIPWVSISEAQGVIVSCKPPDSISQLKELISNQKPLEQCSSRQKRVYNVKIFKKPFSDKGATRYPYYGQLEKQIGQYQKCVLKEYKQSALKQVQSSAYFQQMELSAVSSFMSQQFIKECRLNNLSFIKFRFVKSPVFLRYFKDACLENYQNVGEVYNIEQLLVGIQFEKFNSNNGYVNTKVNEEHNETMQAFSHWTYEYSGKLLIIVDLQGAYDIKEEQLVLTDPVIHCQSDLGRFFKTNLGKAGIKEFLKSHKCNKLCKDLNIFDKNCIGRDISMLSQDLTDCDVASID